MNNKDVENIFEKISAWKHIFLTRELDNILIQTYWHKEVFNHELLSDRELLVELYKYIRIYTSDYFLADILPV